MTTSSCCLDIRSAIVETESQLATYQIGFTAPRYIPNEQHPRNMIHLVAYDIADPKRLRLVAKTCEDYGCRIEKSVFECDLRSDDFEALWRTLNEILDPDEDALIAYRICKSCVKQINSAGIVERPRTKLLYIF